MAVAIARALAARKYDLLLTGRDMELLNGLKADLQIRSGITATVLPFDALAYDTHPAFYKGLPSAPDITICAFGVLGDQELGERDWAEAARILNSNFTGAVSILNIVASDFALRGSGVIVGISSVAGDRGRGSNYLYGSAKAGFTAYLSGLRNRMFKKGVTVITVKPGFVATRMTAHLTLPPALTATPSQVAAAVLKAIDRRSNTVYVKGLWKWLMFVICSIPENVFKKLNL
jgi:decaprenylphospho-beta-D-erythro-pentofuranosid-2-ulose 2-reductase